MNEEAHIVEIENLVLTGVNHLRPERLATLIGAEVQRILNGAGFSAATGVADSETRVAAEVAGTVTQSVQGGTEGV